MISRLTRGAAAPAPDEGGVYLAISDLMSGLLLVFVLLVMVLLYKVAKVIEQVQEQRIVIIQRLQQALDAEGIDAEVDETTGDISILDDILFAEGSALLTAKGEAFLDRFIPVYSQVIYSDEAYEHEIVRVVVEGHTSSKGSFGSNMTLSLERAASVLDYVESELEYSQKERFQTKLLGAGRGEIEADQQEDRAKDRRVVFRMQFRGDHFNELFNSQLAAHVQEGE